jgi:hypothetical protein
MIDACYTPFVGTHLMHGMVHVLMHCMDTGFGIVTVDDTVTTTG